MRIGLAFISLLSLLSPGVSRADWPLQRHDVSRTGAARGASDIGDPAAYYRYYLGGSLGASAMVPFDVNADGSVDVIMVTGGRVVARTVTDGDLWSSAPRGFTGVVGLADFDGDGAEDLAVSSSDRVFVLDPRTGAELWAEPAGELGTLGGTRVADFDGDGAMDLLVAECGCCGVNSGYPGAIYTFGGGFGSARRLWELPNVHCGFSRAITVVDIDGSGPPEVVIPTERTLRIWSPATGAMVAESGDVGIRAYWNFCYPAALDADPAEELLCVRLDNNSSVTDRWRVTALDSDGGAGLSILWSSVLAPDDTGSLRVADPVVDLDGDGALELVVSVFDAGAWETRIFDAASGAVRATVPDAIAVGHVAEGTGRQLVTRSDAALSGWTFDGAAVTPTWSLGGHDAFEGRDLARASLQARPDFMVTLDLDMDGDQDLLTVSRDGAASRLVAHAVEGGALTELASYPIAAGTSAQSAFVIPPVTSSNAILAMSYSDGFMVIHDPDLQPAVAGGEFDVARLRTGGYYASGAWRDLRRGPLSAALEAGAPEAIVVADARGALVRLDASEASWASPPRRAWERLFTTAPSIVDGLVDGSRAIACLTERTPGAPGGETDLAVITPDGAERWRAPAPNAPILDLVPARLDDDAVPDLVFLWGEPSNSLTRIRGVSGADGATIWDATPIETGSGRQPSGLAVGRFDGDDRDDVYWQGGATRVISGATGAELASVGGVSYFLPTLYDVDDDPRDEVILHAGFAPIRIVEDDLSAILWQSAEDDRPYPYASVVECPGDRAVLVSGSWQHPARLKLTDLRGAARGTESTLHLGGGARHASRAELDAAGAFAGQLTSVVAHEDLAGDGAPAALVGSTDGFLYWVSPCDGALVHALDFGVAVGQASFADTDRDGLDEILVSVADGFLYGIAQRHAPTPADVIDVDPASPASTTDADFVTTEDTWIARWGAVDGALRYEVGVFDEGGAPLLAERWRDVGTDTEATLSELPLENGRRYHVGVRAWSADGPSVDGVSDGAVVRFPAPPTPDGGPPPSGDAGTTPTPDGGTTPPAEGGCGCRAAGESGPGAGWLLALLGLLFAARRRSHSGKSHSRIG